MSKTIELVLNDHILNQLTDMILSYANQENPHIAILQTALQETQKRIRNLISVMEQGIITPGTKSRMEKLENQRCDLEVAICHEELATPVLTREMIQDCFLRFRTGNLSEPEFQRQIVDCFVNRIYVFGDKLLLSREEALRSILDDNGSPRKSPSPFGDGLFLYDLCGNRKAGPPAGRAKSVRWTLFRPWEIPTEN